MAKNTKKLPIRLIAKDNPYLPFGFIKDMLRAQKQAAEQKTTIYRLSPELIANGCTRKKIPQ
jgi:hypothetical protein